MSRRGFPLCNDSIVIQINDDCIGEGTSCIDTQTIPRYGYLLEIVAVGIRFDQPYALNQLSKIARYLLPLLRHGVVPGSLIINVVGVSSLFDVKTLPTSGLLLLNPILYPLVILGSLNHGI